MQSQTFHLPDLTALPPVAESLLAFGAGIPVWMFEGEMGAGKTTLIKAMCAALGIQDTVQSPTFSLVNVYQSPRVGEVYHFDFYRINSPSEAYDMGAEEYLDSGNICFIEWPRRIEPLWPNAYILLKISALQDTSRSITVQRNSFL